MSLRLVFMGTAELACASLQALCREPAWQVVAAVSQPDKPRGRDLQLQPTPVKRVALATGVPVLQPARARHEDFLAELRQLRPDLIAVAAYGQLLPPALLEIPRLGCLNVHTSLLPKYRGAAPIQWAILNGETETGVTIMQMDAGLDTGGILSQVTTPIADTDDAQTLHDRLARAGGELLVRTIPDYAAGKLVACPQPAEGATYARKITKADGRMDWAVPARVAWNRVRGFTPWPGAFTYYEVPGQGERMLKLWRGEVVPQRRGAPGVVLEAGRDGLLVGCGEGALRLLEVQRQGGRRLQAAEFLAGQPLPPGTRFGDGPTPESVPKNMH